MSSLSSSFMASAIGWNRPKGPCTLGPGRICILATTLRSNQIANSTLSSRKTMIPTDLSSRIQPLSLLKSAVADPTSATADFSNDNGWILLLKSVGIIVFLLLSVLFAIWFERKVVARMQIRPGPNVHGPFGLFQPIADAMKLLLKEDITVRAADKLVYIVAPMISVFCSLLVFA